MNTFELNDVSKRYGNAVALRPTSMHVPAERTVVLLGTSGSGKSTLLRLMLGLIRPDHGAVVFQGNPLGDLPTANLRRRMGFMAQGGGLFPHLTALGNITLVARYLRWAKERAKERVHELAELTQFPPDALNRYPSQLSGGQAQRVSLMRALMLNPEVLLLDEPLGALDPITRYELQADLRHIFERLHKTVVLVTHDLTEAAFFAHRIVLLREGAVVQEGTVDDLFHRPSHPFVTRFVHAHRTLSTSSETA